MSPTGCFPLRFAHGPAPSARHSHARAAELAEPSSDVIESATFAEVSGSAIRGSKQRISLRGWEAFGNHARIHEAQECRGKFTTQPIRRRDRCHQTLAPASRLAHLAVADG